jgi:hypothetical protein
MLGGPYIPKDRRAMLVFGALLGFSLWIGMLAILRLLWLAYL